MKHLCQLVVRNTGAWQGQDWHICRMFERGSNMTKKNKFKFHYAHHDISHYHTTHILGINLTVTVKCNP